ncbi:MAG: thiamine-phosphate kinase [Gammaproteobacteria bacterium]|nr:thiamine-phosphate kinase [Gammaproteobacteria bacterium]
MNEFELIDAVVAELGAAAAGQWVRLGPGDDCAINALPPGMELASSVDALMGDVHFPRAAGAELVGYRALMVSASDLAAMGAAAGFALLAVSLEEDAAAWLRGLARGLREAALELGLPLVGGNIARGPLTITVSVHGHVPAGRALLRSGARAGDGVYVTGELGAAAAALARGGLAACQSRADLDALSQRYFLPRARLEAGLALRGVASSAIDLSDGLLQDLGHISRASGVGMDLSAETLPIAAGATLDHALGGGDDYELCFTASGDIPDLGVPVRHIGRVVAGTGVTVDGRRVSGGYQHFAS